MNSCGMSHLLPFCSLTFIQHKPSTIQVKQNSLGASEDSWKSASCCLSRAVKVWEQVLITPTYAGKKETLLL